jgi:gliding motility-associated-like protein
MLGWMGTANAQISGAEAFLQGNYVEVGINQCGVYGGNSGPLTALGPGPIGPWHPNVPAGLGFVADADQDGWFTGTPDRCGDYFVPGSPEESWAIQVGPAGAVFRNGSLGCFPSDIPGGITGYVDLGTSRRATWEGNLVSGALNLNIVQETVLPTDGLYFVTNVQIRNDGAASVLDLYYGRSVDPDNDQPTAGTFFTTNTVVSQPPAACEALVTAIGDGASMCFLGLGARSEDARAAIGNSGITFTMTSPYDIWNSGPGYDTTSLATITNDWSISLAFRIEELLPGETRTLSYAYVLDPSDLNAGLDATASIFADTIDVTLDSTVTYCVGDSLSLSIIGGGAYDWSWSPSIGLSTDTGSTVFAAPDVPTTYNVVGIRDFCDTIFRDITVVPVDPDGLADAGPDLSICAGDTINLAGVPAPLGITWSPAANLADPNDPSTAAWPPVTTMYIMSAETGAVCPSIDTMIVTVNPSPDLMATNDTTICAGDTLQLSATNAVTYQWLPVTFLDDAGIAEPISIPDSSLQYTVEAVDGFGCIGYDTVNVTVLGAPAVDAGPDWLIDLVLDEIANLNGVAPTALTFTWTPVTGLDDPSILTPSAQPEEPTTYILTVTDANGCVNSDTVFVDVKNEFSIILPDAFTPNGDGLNDVWRPVTIGLIEVVDVSVYNRWGERVFFTTERYAGWDGTYKGQPQEMETYIAVLRIRDPKGNPVQQTSTVTLIR